MSYFVQCMISCQGSVDGGVPCSTPFLPRRFKPTGLSERSRARPANITELDDEPMPEALDLSKVLRG